MPSVAPLSRLRIWILDRLRLYALVGMAHFKRRRRKDARAGCLMCKWHKSTAHKGRLAAQRKPERLARVREREQREEIGT